MFFWSRVLQVRLRNWKTAEGAETHKNINERGAGGNVLLEPCVAGPSAELE